MITLRAKTRQEKDKTEKLREAELIPAVLYGPNIKKNLGLQVSAKEFPKVFKEAGKTSFVELEVSGGEKPQSFSVLIHEVQKNPLDLSFSHIDFYQPSSTREIKVKVPLVFEGESPAVKNLTGTLVKNIQEVEVKALPQKLPHEIRVKLESLDEIGKTIVIKDLNLPEGVRVMKDLEEIVAQIQAPEKIEEELEKPVEEKVEEVKTVEKEEKEKEPEEPQK
jgi:large subunit ribosomal protein L25